MFNKLIDYCFLVIMIVLISTVAVAQQPIPFKISDFPIGASIEEVSQIASQKYGDRLIEGSLPVYSSVGRNLGGRLLSELGIKTYYMSDHTVFVFYQQTLVQLQRRVLANGDDLGTLIAELQKIYGGDIYAKTQKNEKVQYDPQKLLSNYYNSIIYSGSSDKYEVWLSTRPSNGSHSVVYSAIGLEQIFHQAGLKLEEYKKEQGKSRIGNMGL